MTSTLTLYYNTKLLPDKNLALDNAGSGKGVQLYLQSVTSKSIVGFQYVKHGLSISIRLNESQSKLAMGANAEDLNYCRIQNGTENPLYYFVVGKSWKAQNTIELSLVMDTLNSFEFNVDYPLSAKTLVHREHHRRLEPLEGRIVTVGDFVYGGSSWSYFYTDLLIQTGLAHNPNASLSVGYDDESFVVSSCIMSTDSNGVPGISVTGTHTPGKTVHLVLKFDLDAAYRKIHKPSEDIQAPKRKTKSETLFEGYGFSWNLLYRNKDIPDEHNQYENPVDCFLIPDEALSIKVPLTEPIIDSGSLVSGKYMLFFPDYDPATIEFEGKQYTPYKVHQIGTQYYHYAYAIYNNGGTFELYSTYINVYNDASSTLGWWTKVATASDPILLLNPNPVHVRIVDSLPTGSEMSSQQIWKREKATTTLSLGTTGTQTILPLSSIDRTDPRNIKLIKLPYSPSDISVDNSGIVTLSSEWSFDSNANLIKLISPDTPFIHKVRPRTSMSIWTPLYVSLRYCTRSTLRDKKFESKLFHSDFLNEKFVYDSFSKNMDLERIDSTALTIANPDYGYFEFTFVTSRNVVSKFLFDLTQYASHVEETQDYNHVVCVARNNEEALYNSQYLNYLRTGYNYDLKTKERTELSAGVGIGLNVAALMASIGLSFIPGAQGIGLASAVASGFGLAGQLVNYAKTTAQNDQNIAQKLQEAQMQGVSVQNADDVDLLDYYSQNKAMLCEYKVSDEMENALFNLFHYCGYKTDLQKVPDKSTRWWFNFVQADLVFVDTANLNSDIEEDLKTRFKDGVTFLHYRGSFDFNQEKENWEFDIAYNMED